MSQVNNSPSQWTGMALRKRTMEQEDLDNPDTKARHGKCPRCGGKITKEKYPHEMYVAEEKYWCNECGYTSSIYHPVSEIL